jgi:hypothetical protein
MLVLHFGATETANIAGDVGVLIIAVAAVVGLCIEIQARRVGRYRYRHDLFLDSSVATLTSSAQPVQEREHLRLRDDSLPLSISLDSLLPSIFDEVAAGMSRSSGAVIQRERVTRSITEHLTQMIASRRDHDAQLRDEYEIRTPLRTDDRLACDAFGRTELVERVARNLGGSNYRIVAEWAVLLVEASLDIAVSRYESLRVRASDGWTFVVTDAVDHDNESGNLSASSDWIRNGYLLANLAALQDGDSRLIPGSIRRNQLRLISPIRIAAAFRSPWPYVIAIISSERGKQREGASIKRLPDVQPGQFNWDAIVAETERSKESGRVGMSRK